MNESLNSAILIGGLVAMAILALHGIIDAEKFAKDSKTKSKRKKMDSELSKLEANLDKFLSDKSKPVLKLSKKDLQKFWDKANKLDKDKGLSVGQFEVLSKIIGKLSGLQKKIDKR